MNKLLNCINYINDLTNFYLQKILISLSLKGMGSHNFLAMPGDECLTSKWQFSEAFKSLKGSKYLSKTDLNYRPKNNN